MDDNAKKLFKLFITYKNVIFADNFYNNQNVILFHLTIYCEQIFSFKWDPQNCCIFNILRLMLLQKILGTNKLTFATNVRCIISQILSHTYLNEEHFLQKLFIFQSQLILIVAVKQQLHETTIFHYFCFKELFWKLTNIQIFIRISNNY